MRAVLLLSLCSLCGCGRTTAYGHPPVCARAAEQPPQLHVQETNGLRRLWDKERCVPVTYAPTLEKLKPTLQLALDAWDQVDCTGLCFDPMVANKAPPTDDRDRRLHIADTGTSSGSAWELLNDGRDGQTLHATIFVGSKSNVGELLKQLGFVLGFEGQAAQPRDTVLEEVRIPNPRTGLGALDRQSVCAVYPACR